MMAEALAVLESVGCVLGAAVYLGQLCTWGSCVFGVAVGKILVLKQFSNFDR